MCKPKETPMPGTRILDLLPHFLSEHDPFSVVAREIAPLLSDGDFSELYGVRGPTPVAPKMLALITLFQFMEKRPDREAAHMVKMRLDWKIALNLPLEYEGFHFCLLSEFRARLLASRLSCVVFERVLGRLKGLGLIKAKGKQRLDATHVIGVVRMLSRLELVTESLRLAVEELEARLGAQQVENGLGEELVGFAFTRPDFRKLDDGNRRRTMVAAGRHAVAVLQWVDVPERAHLRDLGAIKVLREVVKQQFKVQENAEPVPQDKKELKATPGTERIATPHDPDARYGEKRGKGWVGYKVEVAETAEAGQPNFITEVQVQNAAEPDAAALEPVVEELEKKDLAPGKLYVDQAYTSGAKIKDLQEQHGIDLRGPVAEEPARGVFPQSRFNLDIAQQTAVCPGGRGSVSFAREANGDIQISFAAADCAGCLLRGQCTTRKDGPRHLTVNANATLLEARRREQQQEPFRKEMHARNAIEGTNSELKRATGLNRSRYRGTEKFSLQVLFSAAAVNVKRLARAIRAGLLPQVQRVS
jgi:transposase